MEYSLHFFHLLVQTHLLIFSQFPKKVLSKEMIHIIRNLASVIFCGNQKFLSLSKKKNDAKNIGIGQGRN
jgi:hypothetical protein